MNKKEEDKQKTVQKHNIEIKKTEQHELKLKLGLSQVLRKG